MVMPSLYKKRRQKAGLFLSIIQYMYKPGGICRAAEKAGESPAEGAKQAAVKRKNGCCKRAPVSLGDTPSGHGHAVHETSRTADEAINN
ncbi:hypothetical protein HMPREF3213_01478 [Heyndrickxia coagulans]|uniref:Uncharacterized protein n=1 Tax=Heyndrickxia coagulans TaxID=1398 RepID=A0A133KTS6_HEYCO|nr:hypothetical protein HMPREF3213_01478 [Heyndrickxia coagulans]